LGVFLGIERRAHEPLLPLDLFRRPVMSVSSAGGAIVGGAMIATLTYVPLYVQSVLGGSPTEAGKAITPMVIGCPIPRAIGGRLIPKVGFRPLIRIGFVITAAAALALALLAHPGMSVWVPRGITAVYGVGLGFANTALLIAVQTSVGWEQRGVATASTIFFRTIGGMLAVGVTGGVLTNALRKDSSIPLDAASSLLGPDHGASIAPGLCPPLTRALEGGRATVLGFPGGPPGRAPRVSSFFPGGPPPPPGPGPDPLRAEVICPSVA